MPHYNAEEFCTLFIYFWSCDTLFESSYSGLFWRCHSTKEHERASVAQQVSNNNKHDQLSMNVLVYHPVNIYVIYWYECKLISYASYRGFEENICLKLFYYILQENCM